MQYCRPDADGHRFLLSRLFFFMKWSVESLTRDANYNLENAAKIDGLKIHEGENRAPFRS